MARPPYQQLDAVDVFGQLVGQIGDLGVKLIEGVAPRSIQTYERIKSLAADIGITQVRVVANKVRDTARAYISSLPEKTRSNNVFTYDSLLTILSEVILFLLVHAVLDGPDWPPPSPPR